MSDGDDECRNRFQQNNSAVILLLDMDSFEWQVETKTQKCKLNIPGIVVNGPSRIVAVSVCAKNLGVTRGMTAQVAVNVCKQKNVNLEVLTKPEKFGKPDNTALRAASRSIRNAVLDASVGMKGVIVECFSNDEFYINVTEEVTKRMVISDGHTAGLCQGLNNIPNQDGTGLFLEARRQKHKLNAILHRINKVYPNASKLAYQDEVRLLYGAVIGHHIMDTVKQRTGYLASVGVAHNKLVAKLSCGVNKPNSITVLTLAGFPRVSKKIPLEKVPELGGDSFGGRLKAKPWNCKSMADLRRLPTSELNRYFKYENCMKIVSWGHGVSVDAVVSQCYKDTMSCGKTFYGRNRPLNWDDLYMWFGLEYLAGELALRLNEEWSDRFSRLPISIKLIINSSVSETVQFPNNLPLPFTTDAIVQITYGLLNGYRNRNANFPGSIKEIKILIPKFELTQ